MQVEVKISITDRNAARSWRADLAQVDEEYKQAMQEAANVLQEAKDFGEGTLVDELVEFGHGIMTAAENIFNAASLISNAISSTLDLMDNMLSGARNLAQAAFGKIFG